MYLDEANLIDDATDVDPTSAQRTARFGYYPRWP